ncbi:MAG: N-acetylgalactosamine 6-sulfate sulfatase [Planctomycetota bacterium]|nr:MAG: N-acetylgalactosamine 6-sulfate sulfatase [Planctomycetota bacterium]
MSLLAFLLAAAPLQDTASVRPNVVLLMADDLGWGDVGFNGNDVIQTPHLDAMAAAGLRFERFYAGAPVCSPTRGSVLTGRHPYRYGIHNANVGHLPTGERGLAELLRGRGYRTGHFGKWHLGTLTETEADSNRGGPKGAKHYAPPWERGFDVSFSTEAKVPTFDPMRKPGQESGSDEPYGTAYWETGGVRATENLAGDDSRVIMDRVVPFVEDAVRRGVPFFAVVWFHAPHRPVIAGPAQRERYSAYATPEQHYYGCITALDEQVGRLRATLRSLGVAEDTLLWFCSDNGPELNGPGSTGGLRGRKRSLHEGGIRVPAVLEWPARVAPGAVTAFPAVTSDILPTILAELGLAPAGDRPLDGISLSALLRGETRERSAPIAFQSGGQEALIEGRYKLMRARGPGPWQLYDLELDRGETRNLAGEKPELVERLASILEAWRRSCERSESGADYH